MHLRHSAYADFAAQARLEMLERLGMNMAVMQAERIGPILFREETVYLREVHLGNSVKVSCLLSKCREDGSRWSFVQEIYRDDEVLAARIQVDGAWIDMVKRKLNEGKPRYPLGLLQDDLHIERRIKMAKKTGR